MDIFPKEIHRWLTTTHHQGKVKTTMRYPSNLSEWLLSKRKQWMWRRGTLCTADGNVNWCRQYGKQYGIPQKIKNKTTMWSSDSTLEYLSKKPPNTQVKDTHIPVFFAACAECPWICCCCCHWVQSLSCVQLFVTPWTEACQVPRSTTVSQSLLKLMSTECMNRATDEKMWLTNTMHTYSEILAVKKNDILPLVTTLVDLESITPSETSQIEKNKCCMISPTCEI